MGLEATQHRLRTRLPQYIRLRVPTSLYHSQTSLVSAQQCDGCLDVHLAVQHSPYCSDPDLAVQAFIWLFKHSFGCSSIHLAVQAFIWLFKHSFGCSSIHLAVQTFIWLLKHSGWLCRWQPTMSCYRSWPSRCHLWSLLPSRLWREMCCSCRMQSTQRRPTRSCTSRDSRSPTDHVLTCQ